MSVYLFLHVGGHLCPGREHLHDADVRAVRGLDESHLRGRDLGDRLALLRDLEQPLQLAPDDLAQDLHGVVDGVDAPRVRLHFSPERHQILEETFS